VYVFCSYEHVSGRRLFLMLGVVGEDRTLRLTAGSSNFLFLFFFFFSFSILQYKRDLSGGYRMLGWSGAGCHDETRDSG
jgi:hypothetical protein